MSIKNELSIYLEGIGACSASDWQGLAVGSPLLATPATYAAAPLKHPVPDWPAAGRAAPSLARRSRLHWPSDAKPVGAVGGAMPARWPMCSAASAGRRPTTGHAICETLAGTDRLISPTRFHNSVPQRSGAGYWGIAMKCMAPLQPAVRA